MAIPEKSAAEILAKCARHCCICRRFRPLHLQVHHIVEQAEGGSDDLDNLIAICVTCHSDVHTSTRLTRRFTIPELKLHRDAVCQLVSEGKLPAGEHIGNEAIESLSAAIVEQLKVSEAQHHDEKSNLSADSVKILLAAICEESAISVQANDSNLHVYVEMGGQGLYLLKNEGDFYPEPIQDLLDNGLIDKDGTDFKVTHAGFTLADTLVSSQSRFTMKKVKCLCCGLHFIICTWFPDKHTISNLYCPECGQGQGSFLVWQQREFGFIFQFVPGKAQTVEMGSLPLPQK